MELKRLEVGQHVRYCSEDRIWYDALVTAIHGDPRIVKDHQQWNSEEQECFTVREVAQYPCVNLSFVSSDESAQDQYGRQMIRDKTSIPHFGEYVASGFFWCHPEDEEEAYNKMCEAMKNIKS